MTQTAIDPIWELLSNPARDQIATSQWLLLYSVSKHGSNGGHFPQIREELHQLVKNARDRDNDFFLMWSSGYDLKDMLCQFCKTGFLQESQENPTRWKITKRGKQLLRQGSKFAPKGVPF